MEWKSLTRAVHLAAFLDLPFSTLRAARRQRLYVYVEVDRLIKGKLRHLCYPRQDSELRQVQSAIKERCLESLPLSPSIRGYRRGHHHISCAAAIAGLPYVAKLDLKDFHPSIKPALVTQALRRFGVSHPMCRIITQLTTYKDQVPQGAPTSNHIANLVIDMVLASRVQAFCKTRAVTVVNFGDDTAFGGTDQSTVDECVQFAKEEFGRFELTANNKSSRAEHVGAARKFIGTNTSRGRPDLTRKKFREYRNELRTALNTENSDATDVKVDEGTMRSLYSKIAYVKRLNKKKARPLTEEFFRLRQVRLEKLTKFPVS